MLITGGVLVLIGGFMILFGRDSKQLDKGAMISFIGVVLTLLGEADLRLDRLERQFKADQIIRREVGPCDS